MPSGYACSSASRQGEAVASTLLPCDVRAGVLGLDPRSHLPVLVAVSVAALLVVSFPPLLVLQVLAMAYLAGNGHARLAMQCGLSFVVVRLLCLVPIPGLYGVLFVSMLHMLPPFTCACALLTTSPSALMSAFSRMRVPVNVLIGVCMTFRFVTILPAEAKSIFRGIRMRGIFPRGIDLLTHPALAYECFYTPLVMRVLRLSSQLAASSELRGIDSGAERTSLHHVGFSARDVIVVAAAIALSAGVGLLDVVL